MKNSPKFRSITFAVATMLIGTSADSAELVFGPLVRPHDDKVHAGSFCQPLVGTQAGNLNTVSFGIDNVGRFPTSVTCPIVRDNVLNTDGNWTSRAIFGGAPNLSVRVFNPTGGRLPCSLFSFNSFRNAVATNTVTATTPGDQTLRLNVNNSVAGGQYSIICTLPKGGRLYNYWVREYTPTDPN